MSNDEDLTGEFTDSELLWRNVHPSFWDEDGGQPSSQAFRPTAKDEGLMSVAREARVSAQDHFVDYTETHCLQSAGVWALSVAEVVSLELDLEHDEYVESRQPCPTGHTSIGFLALSGSQASKMGRRLRALAVARGKQAPIAEASVSEQPVEGFDS